MKWLRRRQACLLRLSEDSSAHARSGCRTGVSSCCRPASFAGDSGSAEQRSAPPGFICESKGTQSSKGDWLEGGIKSAARSRRWDPRSSFARWVPFRLRIETGRLTAGR
jgi:hypothetical protein